MHLGMVSFRTQRFLPPYDTYKPNTLLRWGLDVAISGLYLKIPSQNITVILLANSDGLTGPYANDFSEMELSSIPSY
jgi:hypothetical protein